MIGERAKRVRHYQGCTNLSWCGTEYVIDYTKSGLCAHITGSKDVGYVPIPTLLDQSRTLKVT